VAVLFFIGTLFPALGFVDVYPFRYSYVADHFQYLASLGLITLAGAGVACFLPSSVIPRRMAVLVPVSWLVLLSLKTVLQTGCYRDLFVFYEEIILQNPSCWMAHNNLSHLELSRGRVDRALSLSQEAVRLNPDDAESRVNLGNTLFVKGRAAEAISCYQEAVRLKPKLAQAYSDLGNALLLTGKSVDAISQFQKAIELSPTFPEGHNNLGYAYLMMGRTEEAREKFLEALRLNPDYRKARENLQEAEAQLKVKQYRAKTAR
jgi:tetratricopeptide (TPR) repeat protein